MNKVPPAFPRGKLGEKREKTKRGKERKQDSTIQSIGKCPSNSSLIWSAYGRSRG